MTIRGELLPNSMVTRFKPALAQIRSPTSRLPVKVIFGTRLSEQSESPISLPEPVMHWMADGGSPASSKISVSFRAESGVSVAGLMMTLLPAAKAGPQSKTKFRKLKGPMPPAPQGIGRKSHRLPDQEPPANHFLPSLLRSSDKIESEQHETPQSATR